MAAHPRVQGSVMTLEHCKSAVTLVPIEKSTIVTLKSRNYVNDLINVLQSQITNYF